MKSWTMPICFAAACVVGSGCGSTDPMPQVRWKDAAGSTWWAPMRTPAEDDAIWTERPGAGVVLVCSKTGEESLVADPEGWLANRGRPNSPFRSRVDAPLILPPENRRAAVAP